MIGSALDTLLLRIGARGAAWWDGASLTPALVAAGDAERWRAEGEAESERVRRGAA